MPNWCSNAITIVGRTGTITKIKNLLDYKSANKKPEDLLIFETLLGYDTSTEEYNKNWYELNNERYGTKWDVSVENSSIEYLGTEIKMYFDTAWCPPINFLQNLSEKYKDLEIHIFYEEPGMYFSGEQYFNRGSQTHSEEYDYEEGLYRLRRESWWDHIEYQIENSIDEGEDFNTFISERKFIEDKKIIKELRDRFNQALNNK